MPYGQIYGLYDPRDEALRYVGQTTRSLKKRLQEHDCTEVWRFVIHCTTAIEM